MLVLGLDPGNEKSALVAWDGTSIKWMVLAENEAVRKRLISYREDPLYAKVPLAMEMISSFGMAVGSEIFSTCVWIGRFMESYDPGRCKLITRGEVKMHLCMSMRAKDSNVRTALIDRFGPAKKGCRLSGVKKDLWSALAVAATFLDKACS